ncbi:hypothetical protein [Maribacter litoralis]|uniref:hypothetical protein n=1 Tax=Maribacter litoralis TaxID=2059726 RepID=UPI003F5CD66E
MKKNKKQSALFWIEYLNLYCIEKGQTGMTVSNIVGSVRLNTIFKKYSINDFLTEILIEDYELLISNCPDIEELVVGKFKNWNAPKKYFQSFGTIYFSKSDFQTKIMGLRDLTLELEKRYQIRIENKTYSKDEGSNSWIFLSDEDKQNHLLVNEKLGVK